MLASRYKFYVLQAPFEIWISAPEIVYVFHEFGQVGRSYQRYFSERWRVRRSKKETEKGQMEWKQIFPY